MTNSRKPVSPKLCKQPDAQAYVRIRGKFHYLCKYGTPEAVQRYHALMAEVAVRPGQSGRQPRRRLAAATLMRAGPLNGARRRKRHSRFVYDRDRVHPR